MQKTREKELDIKYVEAKTGEERERDRPKRNIYIK